MNLYDQDIELAIVVPDTARADVLLTDERIFYRFATPDTLDDGDMPGLYNEHYTYIERFKEAVNTKSETPANDGIIVKCSICGQQVENVSESALRKIVNLLINIDDTFLFLQGFI